MQKHKNPLPLLVLCVTLACLGRLLLPLLPGLSVSESWHVADVLRPVGMTFALAAVLHLLPWAELRLCCIVSALVGYHVADAVLCALWYWFGIADPGMWTVIQFASFGGAGMWYYCRSYDQPSDPLDDEHVFCLRMRPRKPQELFLSLLGCFGANGAYAIYAAGNVYHFRKGVLVVTKYDPRYFSNYIITRGSALQLHHILELDGARGVKWSLTKNCVTIFGNFWRRYGR